MLRRLRKWWRGRWLCACCGDDLKNAHYWEGRSVWDGKHELLCDACIAVPCYRMVSPGEPYWVHRVGVGG